MTAAPPAWLSIISSITSAVEGLNDPVELLGLLHEHEVRAAHVLLEDFGMRPLDLASDQDLRLPGNEARFAANNQSWEVDRRNAVSTIVGGVIEQQMGGILGGHL